MPPALIVEYQNKWPIGTLGDALPTPQEDIGFESVKIFIEKIKSTTPSFYDWWENFNFENTGTLETTKVFVRNELSILELDPFASSLFPNSRSLTEEEQKIFNKFRKKFFKEL